MVVAGTITVKMAPRVKKLWDQMPEPKWCIAMGSCAISGDFYRNLYSVVPGHRHLPPGGRVRPGLSAQPRGADARVPAASGEDPEAAARARPSPRSRIPTCLRVTKPSLPRMVRPRAHARARSGADRLVPTHRAPRSRRRRRCAPRSRPRRRSAPANALRPGPARRCCTELGIPHHRARTAARPRGAAPRGWRPAQVARATGSSSPSSPRTGSRARARRREGRGRARALRGDLPAPDGGRGLAGRHLGGAARARPSAISSLVQLFAGADWQEREQYDLVGVVFADHPDLRRLMMPENYDRHPLRHDLPAESPATRPGDDRLADGRRSPGGSTPTSRSTATTPRGS